MSVEFLNITFDEYRELDLLNNSSLQILRRGNYEAKFSSKSLEFGDAFHKLILEPAVFDDEFYVIPKMDLRTKEGKEKKKAIDESNKGKTCLSHADFTKLMTMKERLMGSEVIRNILDSCKKEVTAIGELEGHKAKARIDLYDDENKVIIDLKSTADCSERKFLASMWQYGYFRQGAFYKDLLSANQFYFLAVENVWPHDFNLFRLTDEMHGIGQREYKKLIDIKTGIKNKTIKRYRKKVLAPDIPQWIYNELEIIEGLNE